MRSLRRRGSSSIEAAVRNSKETDAKETLNVVVETYSHKDEALENKKKEASQ